MEERPVITDYWRVGQQASKKISPIKLSVKNTDIVYQILRKAKRLKDIDGYKAVYISLNRTNYERISRRKLVSELKRKRLEDPSSRYFIRKYEIVILFSDQIVEISILFIIS